MRLFLLQIVDANAPHKVIQLPGGGPLEVELRARLKAALLAKGVGVLRTEARVAAAFDAALDEVIDSLKRDSRYAVK